MAWKSRSSEIDTPVGNVHFEQYESGFPTMQAAIDMLSGWNSAFPPNYQVVAGKLPLFADTRIHWLLGEIGQLENKSVLEVGPMEGMHTYMLSQAGAASIDAVEANRLCYLRCLVTKEILGLEHARFLLGDINQWLVGNEKKYDLIVASGVLYHMVEPAKFLQRAARRCDNLFLWTHYHTDEAMPEGDPRRTAFTGRQVTSQLEGVTVRTYERRYYTANKQRSFCGGMNDVHYWLHRNDIFALLKHFGFSKIDVNNEDPAHPGGPCFSLLARR